MKVLFLTRATLYSAYGGDTVQICATAKYLRKLGINVDIKLSNEGIDYSSYDLLHVFNVIRPADALMHIKKSGKPYVVSTIFVDFREYHETHDTGISALLGRMFNPDRIEYMKAIARWIKNGERIRSKEYLYRGHKSSVQQLASNAAYLLPNSENEYRRFVARYGIQRPYKVIYNGVDPEIFSLPKNLIEDVHDPLQVLCVARIEGNKNQLNLIKALNNTPFQLKLIGNPAPNHTRYYETCKATAAANISFEGFIPNDRLSGYYQQAKVHVLPSWNETCGLSSMEAAYAGCNIVITDKGDTVDYYGDHAFYCDPDDPASIYQAICKASSAPLQSSLQELIVDKYNWQNAAIETLSVYEKVLSNRIHNHKVREAHA